MLARVLAVILCALCCCTQSVSAALHVVRTTCSGNGWRGPFYRSRSFSISPSGIIEGSYPVAKLASLQQLVQQPRLNIDSGLGPFLTSVALRASADEAFRWYSAIAWAGLWTTEQRSAYFAAFTRENILRAAATAYARPEDSELLAHHVKETCNIQIPMRNRESSVEIDVRKVPFVLPLIVHRGRAATTTFNALLSVELSKLFPADEWLRDRLAGGDDWLMFQGGTVGMLLPVELRKTIFHPSDLLAEYERLYEVHLRYDAFLFSWPAQRVVAARYDKDRSKDIVQASGGDRY